MASAFEDHLLIDKVTPTFTITPTLTPKPNALLRSVVAAPNISRDGEPIQFQVNLESGATIELRLYAITGEQIYQMVVKGTKGSNTLFWRLRNQANESISSGLYIYYLRVEDGAIQAATHGKIVVLR
jgi:hypothetical protein